LPCRKRRGAPTLTTPQENQLPGMEVLFLRRIDRGSGVANHDGLKAWSKSIMHCGWISSRPKRGGGAGPTGSEGELARNRRRTNRSSGGGSDHLGVTVRTTHRGHAVENLGAGRGAGRVGGRRHWRRGVWASSLSPLTGVYVLFGIGGCTSPWAYPGCTSGAATASPSPWGTYGFAAPRRRPWRSPSQSSPWMETSLQRQIWGKPQDP
jgi:hypothetical protein